MKSPRNFALTAFAFLFFISQGSLAQSYSSQNNAYSADNVASPRRSMATVILFGLGGAVLGLSTLSFYPKPQENLGNISVGFVVGLIGGGVFVANQTSAANNSDEASLGRGKNYPLLDTIIEIQGRHKSQAPSTFNYVWNF